MLFALAGSVAREGDGRLVQIRGFFSAYTCENIRRANTQSVSHPMKTRPASSPTYSRDHIFVVATARLLGIFVRANRTAQGGPIQLTVRRRRRDDEDEL